MFTLLDTVIFGIFAKVRGNSPLYELFGDDRGMTPAIMQEIAGPIDYGYDLML